MIHPLPDSESSLRIRRLFSASREQVFHAWTEPRAIERWFRPLGSQSRVRHLDLRIGGSFHFELLNSQGEVSAIVGTYLEIHEPEKLVFTWSSAGTRDRETLVTLELSEHGGVTEMLLTHERFADSPMVHMHLVGWESCLDVLTTILP